MIHMVFDALILRRGVQPKCLFDSFGVFRQKIPQMGLQRELVIFWIYPGLSFRGLVVVSFSMGTLELGFKFEVAPLLCLARLTQAIRPVSLLECGK